MSDEPTVRVMSLPEVCRWRESLRDQGRRVVLTNGCFDVLHRGHLEYLLQTSRQGDALVVAVNSDTSVHALKGEGRPVHVESDRAYALGCLRFVDAVFIFEGPRLDTEIRELRPDVYTKAGDYTPETLDRGEKRALDDVGAKIKIMPFVGGHSSTQTIQRMGLGG